MHQSSPAFDYARSFRCIGSACEDTCCRIWNVPIDQATYEKYGTLPAGPLRELIEASVLLSPPGAYGSRASTSATFATIRMSESNQCPMLSADRLCRIQQECGEQFLSVTCATYPRIIQSIAGIEETALALSCPEAARLVLLDLGLLNQAASVTPLEGNPAGEANPSLLSWFNPIRQTTFALLRNRVYPLWQRLFLMGVLCRRLDSIAQGELARSVPAFLLDFDATVASGALHTAMATLPLDRAAQLDAVLRLAGMLLNRSNITPRFVECIQAFTAGIGNGPAATLDSLTAHYSHAHDSYYAPFFDRHPYILENLLMNTIVRCRFPFGREEMRAGTIQATPDSPTSLTRQFALLTAQFALIKGLLIGVAGYHRAHFSTAHVVHTVQAASKHFEHHPEFLNMAHVLLVESGLDGARGLAILLRNAAPTAPSPPSPEKYAPSPQAGTAV